jgi:hypothetical protein
MLRVEFSYPVDLVEILRKMCLDSEFHVRRDGAASAHQFTTAGRCETGGKNISSTPALSSPMDILKALRRRPQKLRRSVAIHQDVSTLDAERLQLLKNQLRRARSGGTIDQSRSRTDVHQRLPELFSHLGRVGPVLKPFLFRPNVLPQPRKKSLLKPTANPILRKVHVGIYKARDNEVFRAFPLFDSLDTTLLIPDHLRVWIEGRLASGKRSQNVP